MKDSAASPFRLDAPYGPGGDQPSAIQKINEGFRNGEQFQVLMGVTGSGKTFTMANVIRDAGLPVLILSHNKTLVAQLYQEFRAYFPDNAVEYFVSYFDYYQPEAYLPTTDTYIEKDSSINEEIEKLRLKTTASLMSRKDVIVVASVSCIYGLGSPAAYQDMMLEVRPGMAAERDRILKGLVDIHYSRNDFDFRRGTFRVRGDIVDVLPAYDDDAVRIEFFGDTVEKVSRIRTVDGRELASLEKALIYPAKHFVTREEGMDRILAGITAELEERLVQLRKENKLVEAQRLESRTRFDMEMLAETGFCSGIENYSRIIDNRLPGTPPHTLMDFFGDDYLLIVDESHASIPQVNGMSGGDRARKQTLVDFGFRLPSALDNRPLNFAEFEGKMPRTLFVSATPADYEVEKSGGKVAEQIVRPTGLLDPEVEVRPVDGQIDDMMAEIAKKTAAGEKTLVITLTKKSAEDLTDFLSAAGMQVLYMHSDTATLRRTEILRELREGKIDVLVGINLLREGLDLPEVSLIVILDADKEGFLRNRRTLIQVMGRAARNINGRVIMYADKITGSMREALDETSRRRRIQERYNADHGIRPATIIKEIREAVSLAPEAEARAEALSRRRPVEEDDGIEDAAQLEKKMFEAADRLDFETAARLRDKIQSLKGTK